MWPPVGQARCGVGGTRPGCWRPAFPVLKLWAVTDLRNTQKRDYLTF